MSVTTAPHVTDDDAGEAVGGGSESPVLALQWRKYGDVTFGRGLESDFRIDGRPLVFAAADDGECDNDSDGAGEAAGGEPRERGLMVRRV